MPDTPPDPAEQEALAAAEDQPRHPLRRLGCFALLALWFMLLLTPCALFYLAANGEIRFSQPGVPQPHAQPRLLIALINDPDNRGLQVMRSSPVGAPSDTDICIQTAVNYLFWETRGGNQDTVYCDCYTRADANANWTLRATHSSTCA